MHIDLALAKQHMRVTHDAEDALIALYLRAAQESAQQYLNRTVYMDAGEMADGIAAGDLTGMVMNSSIESAVYLIAAHLHANREDVVTGVSVTQLPSGSHALLWPFRANPGV